MRRFRQQQKVRETLIQGDLSLSLRYLDLIRVVLLSLILDLLAAKLAPYAHWLVPTAGHPFGRLDAVPSVVTSVPVPLLDAGIAVKPPPRIQLIDV